MGEMLRSDPMVLCEMYLQPETAYPTLSKLGEIGCVQFLDMNEGVQAFMRQYVPEICRCSEMERRLRYMEDEMRKDDIYVPELLTIPPAMPPQEMCIFENHIEKWETDVVEMSSNLVKLLQNYLELNQMYYVLQHVGPMIGTTDFKRDSVLKKGADIDSTGRLYIATGVVQRRRSYAFQMMLWRISHGNIYYRQTEEDKILKDPTTGQDVRKVAFLAVCQGDQLSTRMEKVFYGFHVDLYPCPTSHSERQNTMSNLETSLKDLDEVLRKTKYHRCKALRTIGRQLPKWMIQIKKAKAIYHTMNLFSLDITKKCLIGQCWIPVSDLQHVQHILDKASQKMATAVSSFVCKVDTQDTPPTFHRTNKFTHGFQALINAYGDSCYRELNPGLYTIITFPFLFSLMFGDVCHGFIMFLFAAWMLKNEKKFMAENSTNEIWIIFFGGRYIILLMSLFSMFAGFIYNDFFSKGVALVEPGWAKVPYTYTYLGYIHEHELQIRHYTGSYMFGVDPVWKLASNKILFENSLKMKLSIIIGVIHMIFGLSLSLFNHMYFKKRYLIFLEFIPQMLFLCCIFFWLVLLIFVKWFLYGGASTILNETPPCSPMILILFIDMVLFSTSKPPFPECEAYIFAEQDIVQKSLVVVALVCVPVMLFGPPCYSKFSNSKRHKKLLKEKTLFLRRMPEDPTPEELNKKEWYTKELEKLSEPFADHMIHQAVHTIEFVLSTISHTASYLRLWALSLAHAQLSEMLWAMVLSKLALQYTSYAGAFQVFIIFAVWAVFSLSILVLMEGLSAFLHTLRLHWVEFMSKFYGGCGYVFHPFSFSAILSDTTKEKQEVCVAAKRRQEV